MRKEPSNTPALLVDFLCLKINVKHEPTMDLGYEPGSVKKRNKPSVHPKCPCRQIVAATNAPATLVETTWFCQQPQKHFRSETNVTIIRMPNNCRSEQSRVNRGRANLAKREYFPANCPLISSPIGNAIERQATPNYSEFSDHIFSSCVL